MGQACMGVEIIHYLHPVLRPIYTSLETRKGMGQACMGGEIINYLHPVLRPIHLLLAKLRPATAWGRLVLMGRSLTIYTLCLILYTLLNCLIRVVHMLTLNRSLKRENVRNQITLTPVILRHIYATAFVHYRTRE